GSLAQPQVGRAADTKREFYRSEIWTLATEQDGGERCVEYLPRPNAMSSTRAWRAPRRAALPTPRRAPYPRAHGQRAKKTEHAERALQHGKMKLVSLPRRHARHLESPRRSGAFSTIEPFDDVHVIVPSPSGDSVTTTLLDSTACSDPPAILTSKTPPALPAER